MENNSKENVKTIDELADNLKEIYNILKSRKMTQKDVRQKYGITNYAMQDLLDIDEMYLEPNRLQDIVDLLNEGKTIRKIGAELQIGNAIIVFIKNSLKIKNKQHDKNEKYEKLYKKAQHMWQRVIEGERIEDIAKNMGMPINDTEELVYKYSELINRLQNYYKENKKIEILEKYKRRYYLEDDVISYIKEGRKNDNIKNVVNIYLNRYGIKIKDKEGSEHGEL